MGLDDLVRLLRRCWRDVVGPNYLSSWIDTVIYQIKDAISVTAYTTVIHVSFCGTYLDMFAALAETQLLRQWVFTSSLDAISMVNVCTADG